MRRTWLHRIRLKVLAMLAAIGLAAGALVSLELLPLWPVVGIAIAAVAVVVDRVTTRLAVPTCLSCGVDLSGQPAGEHGVACHQCGAINTAFAWRHERDRPSRL